VSAEIHVGDEGTEIVIALTDGGTALDLTTSTARQMVFRSPSGVVTVLTATVDGSAAEGRIKVLTGPGAGEIALTSGGVWDIQGRVVFAAGRWHTAKGHVRVYPNLENWA
jgi:hypothetical protein